MKALRVLLIGADTAGFCTSLGDSLVGLGSQVFYLARDDFPDYRSTQLRKSSFCRPPSNWVFFKDKNLPRWRKMALRLASHSWRAAFGLRVLYELVFRLGSYGGIIQSGPDSGLFPGLSDFLLRRRSGRLIVVFHGSDVRPAFLNGAFHFSNSQAGIRRLHRAVQQQVRLVRRAEEIADEIVLWRAITHFFSRPVVLHESIGFPSYVPLETNPSSIERDKLTVFHASSSLNAKGTASIRQICQEFQEEGLPIDYQEVSHETHEQILEKIRKADLVVDQLYTDNLSSVFSIETGRLGKPVISSGWSVNPDFHFANQGLNLPPILFAHTRDFKTFLRTMIVDANQRRKVSQRLTNFYSCYWTPTSIGNSYLSLILEDRRKEIAHVDPLSSKEPFGGYGPEEEVRRRLELYVEYSGEESLFLSHNPHLERNVLQWAVKNTAR